MPPTKVCPQCKTAVPVRQKTCERCDHVFRSKRKAECNLREKAMKRMRAVESDSVKSDRKTKDKLHKACERVPETHTLRNKVAIAHLIRCAGRVPYSTPLFGVLSTLILVV